MIRVTDVGYNFIHFGGLDIRRPQGEDRNLLIFFRSNAQVLIEGEYRPVERASFFLYPKGTPQYYRKTDGDYINDWMYFDLEGEDGYFQKLNIPLSRPIRLRNPAPLNTMMLDMFNDFFFERAGAFELLSDKANSFFHRSSVSCALELGSPGKRNIYLNELNDLRNKLLSFSFIPRSTEALARSMNMSVSSLEHTYKALFQTTIAQDMIRGRIQNACILLRNTNYSAADIAAICGYENPEHFSRQFKRLTGCTPGQYRSGGRKA